MLKALELENFKAFGQRNRIEFAPITLIFGENSAGKSSILQALNLLKQTRQSREHGALLLPRTEAGIVELGGFQELLFDHDLQLELSIRVDLTPGGRRKDSQWSDETTGKFDVESEELLGFEAAFARPSDESEIELRRLTFYASAASGCVAEFKPMSLTTGQPAARCKWLTDNRDFWSEIYARSKRRSEKIVDELQHLRAEGNKTVRQASLFKEVEEEERLWQAEIDKAIEFYESEFTIGAFIKRMRKAEMQTVIGLDGFIPLVDPRTRQREVLPELDTFRRFGPSRLRMRDLTLDLGGFAVDCGRMLDEALERLYPMGPYRRPPQRWYIFTGTSPHDVGYRGDLLPDLLYRRPELVDETNVWLDKLEIGYHIKVQSVGTRSRDLFEVRLIDKRRGRDVDVALSDVGFGVSQILPFIVQSLAGEQQIITIEQPEVHIHPRLQADLGDLVAASSRLPRLHRFIIETHSEHLVLRMQRLVREGRLKPDDISVIYVSRGANGSGAQRLHLDSNGDFLDDWPGGFFPERLRELM